MLPLVLPRPFFIHAQLERHDLLRAKAEHLDGHGCKRLDNDKIGEVS